MSDLAEAVARTAASRTPSIAAILVDQGKLRVEDIPSIQGFASARGLWFGDAAVQMNLLSQEDLENAVARQFSYTVLDRERDGIGDDVVAAHDPQHPVVNEFRALRSQLMFRWYNRTERRALAITSPGRGEGKTRLAANLAVAFAQIGERTLLIDSNLRQPRLHELFRVDNAAGLSALLMGRVSGSVVQRVHRSLRLFVLPAGNPPPNPQELLSRPTLELVLQRFLTQYDLVILDTPAASESSDAQVIAARAQSALVVARRDVTREAQLDALAADFRVAGVNLVGCVLSEH